jgi:hypothetical protein
LRVFQIVLDIQVALVLDLVERDQTVPPPTNAEEPHARWYDRRRLGKELALPPRVGLDAVTPAIEPRGARAGIDPGRAAFRRSLPRRPRNRFTRFAMLIFSPATPRDRARLLAVSMMKCRWLDSTL